MVSLGFIQFHLIKGGPFCAVLLCFLLESFLGGDGRHVGMSLVEKGGIRDV